MKSKHSGSATILNVVIETPRLSHIKYKYDEASGFFAFDKLLPAGQTFPLNYGFVPSTLAPDGDPLDVLLLLEEPLAVGCLVRSRLIGVLEAEQTEETQHGRNDRLICAAEKSHIYQATQSMSEVAGLLDEIERFFIRYNESQKRKFKVLGRFGVRRALKTIRACETAYRQAKQRIQG